jgi:hypothetical protein
MADRRRSPAKKSAAKKSPAAKKSAAKKSPATKKSAAKKSPAAKKSAAKKSPASRSSSQGGYSITTVSVVPCCQGIRTICVLPIPKETPRVSKGVLQTHQAMYFSTGQSNPGANFPGGWFPTAGIKTDMTPSIRISPDGEKIECSSGMVIKFTSTDKKPFTNTHFFWRERLCELMGENGLDCGNYRKFLSKFGFFYQLSMSAQLGGVLWDMEDMKPLKDIVMSYNWKNDKDWRKRDFANVDEKDTYLVSSSTCEDFAGDFNFSIDNHRIESGVLVNRWLDAYGALFGNVDDETINVSSNLMNYNKATW